MKRVDFRLNIDNQVYGRVTGLLVHKVSTEIHVKVNDQVYWAIYPLIIFRVSVEGVLE